MVRRRTLNVGEGVMGENQGKISRRGGPKGPSPMPHKIFEIDEILRVIVWYTKDISETTTVSLACCCKSFEEPALSLLWVRKSLNRLTALFPSILTRTPTEEEWNRFRRCASWIQVLSVDLTPGYVTQELTPLLNVIASHSIKRATTVFPNLRGLAWYGEPSSLTFLPSFVSPILTDLRVHIATVWGTEHLPGEYAPLEFVINSTISPSNLRSFCLDIHPESNPSPELKRSIADLILRCGSTLTDFEAGFEIPESAILHLMSLPNLVVWRAAQPAPMEVVSSPLRPAVSFAQIASLTLHTTTPLNWLSFISALVGQKSHPLSVPHIPMFTFGNLTNFDLDAPIGEACLYSCTFHLTDSDISLLAATLPRLEWVHLGVPCFFNTCQTTFKSLHALSARCPRLQHLYIHINTATIVQDIGSVFEAETHGTRPGSCIGRRSFPLKLWCAHCIPLEANVGVDDLEVVVKGFFAISVAMDVPATSSDSNTRLWAKISSGIKALDV